MKKILLTTVFTGYNYGSSLQAMAGKTMLSSLGYDCQLVAMKSLVKGRDIRFLKLITILFRSFLNVKDNKTFATFNKQYSKTMIGDSREMFEDFTSKYLQPKYSTWRGLKRLANESVACFAGSDQIWNSSIMYVDPLYYLRFAPQNKRIALAPSFGRDYVADYNKNKIRKWISEFSSISVREDSGVKLIKEITGRDATHLVDPTLMLNAATWTKILDLKSSSDNYILAYFLDKPSDKAKLVLNILATLLNCKVVGIPYQYDDMSYCDEVLPTGPVEFLNLIKNAKFVCTDSFHGTAFSINFHTPFYVFERDYGSAQVQSSRVVSILKKTNLLGRYQPNEYDVKDCYNRCDFEYSESVLIAERIKALDYIKSSITKVMQRVYN